MKLEKAIEILEEDKNWDYEGVSEDLENALQLGIEALKRVKSIRIGGKPDKYTILPGETP